MTSQDFVKKYQNLSPKSKLLGQGAFGKVYKSFLLTDVREEVAVKVVSIKKSREYDLEVDILKKLSQGTDEQTKHICKMLDFYVDLRAKTEAKIVMRFVNGGDLGSYYLHWHNVLKNTSFEERLVHTFCQQIVSGVRYIHSVGICHRDLKPGNTLIHKPYVGCTPYEFVLKIADFGLAEYIEENGNMVGEVGTPGYKAPEVLGNQAYTRACDIWSLGIMMMEMVGLYNVDILDQLPKSSTLVIHSELDLRFPRGITDMFKSLVKRTLVVNPAERIKADDFLENDYFRLDFGDLLAPALGQLQIHPYQNQPQARVAAGPAYDRYDRTGNIKRHAPKKN